MATRFKQLVLNKVLFLYIYPLLSLVLQIVSAFQILSICFLLQLPSYLLLWFHHAFFSTFINARHYFSHCIMCLSLPFSASEASHLELCLQLSFIWIFPFDIYAFAFSPSFVLFFAASCLKCSIRKWSDFLTTLIMYRIIGMFSTPP